MQTIVKIIIALFFSHFTVSEPVEEKKEKVSEDHASTMVRYKNCTAPASKLSDYTT